TIFLSFNQIILFQSASSVISSASAHQKVHHKIEARPSSASMAATIATMTMLNAKSLSLNNIPKIGNPSKPLSKPISLLSMKNLARGITISKLSDDNSNHLALTGTAIAGVIFSTLSSCEPAMAAQQLAEIAEGDNRGLALLLPIIPAIAWVLFNILQPALNQINKMRSDKGVIVGLGLGSGLAASGFLAAPHASASEIATIADAATGDNRGQLLLFVVTPAILWVLYNILQPALNQLNKMRSQ
ncbi:photosystem II protein Y, partial [Proteus mirabilis]|nr:photosystem II protein Y [Proteus mirabilis]